MSRGTFPRVVGNLAARSVSRHPPGRRGGTPDARGPVQRADVLRSGARRGSGMGKTMTITITAHAGIGANRTLRRSVSN